MEDNSTNEDALAERVSERIADEIMEQHQPAPEQKEIRWLFDYAPLHLELKARLMGGMVERDSKTGVINIKRAKGAVATMNQTGVEQTMAYISGFITHIQALTYFEDIKEIYRLLFFFNKQLVFFYRENMLRFDLTPAKAALVISLIVDTCEANMRKSLHGATMRGIIPTEHITKVISEQSSRKGGFRFFG